MKIQHLKLKLYPLGNIKNIAELTPERLVEETNSGSTYKKGYSLSSVDYSLTLNEIPALNASIPIGARPTENGAYPAISSNEIDEWMKNKTLVAIVLESYNITFNNSKQVPTAKELKQSVSTLSIPRKKIKLCIFIGTVTAQSIYRTTTNASRVLTITHWLETISSVGITMPVVSPVSPSDLAVACFKDYTAPSNRTDINTTIAGTRSDDIPTYIQQGNIWPAIQALLKLSEHENIYLNSLVAFSTTKELVELSEGVIDRIIDSKEKTKFLEFSDSFEGAITANKAAITSALTAVNVSRFGTSTIWNVLIESLLPSFNIALIPGISYSYVIPTPSYISSGDDKESKKRFVELTRDEYYEIRTYIPKIPTIGSVIVCLMANSLSNYGETDGYLKLQPYPYTKADKPLVLIQAPSWFKSIINTKAISFDTFLLEPYLTDENDPAKLDADASGLRAALTSYAQSMYYTLLYNRRTLEFSSPLRFDLLPGTHIKLAIKNQEEHNKFQQDLLDTDYIYGTIAAVSYSINAESGADVTYTLNNIRSEQEQKAIQEEENAAAEKPVQPIYKNIWNNVENKVYACEVISVND